MNKRKWTINACIIVGILHLHPQTDNIDGQNKMQHVYSISQLLGDMLCYCKLPQVQYCKLPHLVQCYYITQVHYELCLLRFVVGGKFE